MNDLSIKNHWKSILFI